MAEAISGIGGRRGLAADHAADSASGRAEQHDLGQRSGRYDSVGAGRLASFTAGLGGTAAGIDVPVFGTARIGAAVGTVEAADLVAGHGNATSSTAQLVGYGQWQSGMLFADLQLGLSTNRRTCAIWRCSEPGRVAAPTGCGGGGVRVGVQQDFGGWLIEPSLGLVASTCTWAWWRRAAAVARPSVAVIGQRRTTLAASAQRGFALNGASDDRSPA